MPFNAIAQTRYGAFLYNRNDQIIGRSLEVYGEYSEGEVQLLRELAPPGSVVADVGANIGTIAVPLAQHLGERGFLFAFEPQRVVFQTLCANVALQSLTNVECVPVALGAARATLHMPDIDYTRAANFGGLEMQAFQEGRPVEQLTLDDYFWRGPFSLIKIDVEGMELDVLRGAQRIIEQQRPILYVENDRVEKSAELEAALKALGYRLYRHNPLLFNPKNYRGNATNIFGDASFINVMCIPKETPSQISGFEEI